jgi:endo-1,4-beta-xylanase
MLNKKRNIRIVSMLLIALCFLMNNSFCLTADAAMATGKTKWVGNIWYDGNAPTKFADYWNQITPENASKWASCEPQQGVYNFGQAKAMYNYCKTNGIPFKFHTLVWGSQYPSWVNNISGTARKTAVENWIKASAQNFPDADYIDVVNEAMVGHAPPSWKNDIGGDNGLYGTGWDWIVWSFEKARQYFPKSKLLINEYNVLNDYTCIDEYIKVINILKSRGLIDGIGCQSHGLENTSAANLKSRLDKLAATGLPIYISELDLNIADDNTQKSKMQELFPVMYEHSAVQGITMWGYLQGHTWIANSHLLRSDGSERPALTWLKQYIASTPNGNVTVDPRSAFTTIEAESYNDQSGIQTETCTDTNGGQDVGYIENGDYVVYKKIDFGTGAASFKARISSATSGGNIELRLDSPTGALIGTCAALGTGGWQVWTDAKCSVSGVSGKHDLYLKFTGGSGYLFNINWFTFSTSSLGTLGDLNSDGSIDAIDFGMMKKYLLEVETLPNVVLGDLDGSGTVDALDFALLKQYILGIITAFPGQSAV